MRFFYCKGAIKMQHSNTGLAAHAEKALREKWYYGWGAYGQKATNALVTSLVSQYPSMNTQWKSYMQKAVTAGTRLCDCYGLVKSYLWWVDDNANPKYIGVHDTNTAGAYSKATEKGTLATLPEIPGVILYMPGHVGVYCGKGRFIELQGGGVGAFEGKITNGKITKGSKFTHWFKDINIDYTVENEEQEDEEMRYNTLEEIPDYAKDVIKKLINKGVFADASKLDLSLDMIRMFSFNDRAGLYN